MKRYFIVGFLVLAASLFLTVGTARAVDLFNGDVVIHGKVSEQYMRRAREVRSFEEYDYETFAARSTLKLETMWHAYKGPEYQLNFYGVFKQFYDAADHIDGEYKRMLYDAAGGTDKAINEQRSYSSFKDICREMYSELNGPMF